jgi:hypothetical protein
VPENVELFKDLSTGTLKPLGDTQVAEEILLFIESLENITSTIKSDHILNLLQEVEGTLPEKKEQMTSIIKQFLSLNIEEQMLFQIGRRTGVFSRLEDLNNRRLRMYAERNYTDLNVTPQNIDQIIAQLMTNFI